MMQALLNKKMLYIRLIINFCFENFFKVCKNYKTYLLTLISFSIIIKLLLLFFYDVPQPPDARKYINILDYYRAKVGLETDLELTLSIIFTAPYMKIYPSFLFLVGMKVAIFIQIFLSSVSIYLIFNITKIISKNYFIAALAAFLFFLNPFLTYYSLLVQYETLFLFFLLLGINLLLTKRKIFSYFIFIISIFINPVIEIGSILFIFFSSFLIMEESIKKSIKNIIIFLSIYFFFLSLNILHNYNTLGTFERFYVHSVLSLEYNETYAKHGLNFEKISEFHKELNEEFCPVDPSRKNDLRYQFIEQRACSNKNLNAYSYNYIFDRKNTYQIGKNFLVRIQRLFSLYPYDTTEFHVKIISSIYYIFLYFFIGVFFINLKHVQFRKKYYPIIILTLASLSIYVLLHAVFRYRVPYDSFFIIMASYALYNIYDKNRKYISKIYKQI